MDPDRKPRRPQPFRPEQLDSFAAGIDPARVSEIAHESAAVLVHTGRASDDPELTERLVNLVSELGISTLAELWSQQPAVSLPGALWRLYALREWISRDSVGAAADYAEGRIRADVASVIAGSAEPPSPTAMRDLGNAILTGVYEGDFGTALDRAAAFCLVISAGRVHRADQEDGRDDPRAASLTTSAAAMRTTGVDLERCARQWRSGDLD
ncbi:hypothetical protein [Calidifontibacter terrae]